MSQSPREIEVERDYSDELSWRAGDMLTVREFGELTKGTLRYKAGQYRACEDGFASGWDVYDVLTVGGLEASIYGFSVEAVNGKTASAVQP